MANPDHLERLRQGVAAWNAWRTSHPPDLIMDLCGADLRGADLGGADLQGADLSGADLSGANLWGADLSGAGLSRTKFNKAKLWRANLSKARLFATNIHGADLREADLSGARLRGTVLIEADLQGAKLRAAYLSRVVLSKANLRGADLREADLHGTDLDGADLSGADLRGANLSRAGLRGANLWGADLSGADLREAFLPGAVLWLANLVDARLDRANLTGAKLWEVQRSNWSIKGIVCQHAFWDRKGEEPTEYARGEFARIFAEHPHIVLHYPGGMSSIDLLALPLIVERLQAKYPGSVLQVRSVQNDAGGASVTITVENLANRDAEAFEKELVRLETELKCVVGERDFLRHCLSPMLPELYARVAEAVSRPRQEIHIHGSYAPIAIGDSAMNQGDNYNNVQGQVGAFGPNAHAHDNTFQQIQGSIDLPKLAEELGRLRAAMKSNTTGTREQDKAIGAVADAEEAAIKGDGPAVLRHLKSAGTWALAIAEKIGVAAAIEMLKKTI